MQRDFNRARKYRLNKSLETSGACCYMYNLQKDRRAVFGNWHLLQEKIQIKFYYDENS